MKKFTLPVRFGIATSGSLIAYFLILSLFNLHINVFFSLFNGIITGFGIFEAIRYTKIEEGKNFDYRKGFSAGIITGFMATLVFTVFFAFYATEVNINFLPQLSEVWFKNYHTGEGLLFFTVAIMGFATTVVLTLTFMQLFKSSNNLK
ncbi:hypothetical protein Celal_1087 [Cellulophaga algicola DSM 14237]|uniref:DUF4199 domain-containing protein n=1 Tax=Cellulophaga algicola (strain DSM 14237 / IC166 / ACAM 630) TaxID=688270 RepID=E6X5P4_CELAD|nr:membrane protein [Cellulophaga algicola]ADV48410.1 hypothetical protein Celal_1087 [Cellulophaga algicola DSM 14237]